MNADCREKSISLKKASFYISSSYKAQKTARPKSVKRLEERNRPA
jgi:hypothetical protein